MHRSSIKKKITNLLHFFSSFFGSPAVIDAAGGCRLFPRSVQTWRLERQRGRSLWVARGFEGYKQRVIRDAAMAREVLMPKEVDDVEAFPRGRQDTTTTSTSYEETKLRGKRGGPKRHREPTEAGLRSGKKKKGRR